MNHVAHVNEKVRARVGGGRYLQKVVSAATTKGRATERRREEKERAWCVARGLSGILFLRDGHASAAKTLLRLPRSSKFITASRYKLTRGKKRKGGKRNSHRACLRCFLRVNSTTRDSVFQVRLRSLFVRLQSALQSCAGQKRETKLC